MKNNQKIPVSILADREVFEYLKEKGDERKTRTEAYCAFSLHSFRCV